MLSFSNLKSVVLGLSISIAATAGHADLSQAEAAQLEKLRGVPVVSADGAVVGTIDGASVGSDRTKLFLRPVPTGFFAKRRADILVSSRTSSISLQGNAIVLDASKADIRTSATNKKEDDDRIVVFLH